MPKLTVVALIMLSILKKGSTLSPHLFTSCDAVDPLTKDDLDGSLFTTRKNNNSDLVVMYHGVNCGWSQACAPGFCAMAQE